MAEPERKCSTCKFYEPAPIWRKGWCRNPLLYAPQQSHLVAEDDLDCSRGLSDYWEAADGTGPNAGVNVAGSAGDDLFGRGAAGAGGYGAGDDAGRAGAYGSGGYGSEGYGSASGGYGTGAGAAPLDDDGYAPQESSGGRPAASQPRYLGAVGGDEDAGDVRNPWNNAQAGFAAPPREDAGGYGSGAGGYGGGAGGYGNAGGYGDDRYGAGAGDERGYGSGYGAGANTGYGTSGGDNRGGYGQQGGYGQGGYGTDAPYGGGGANSYGTGYGPMGAAGAAGVNPPGPTPATNGSRSQNAGTTAGGRRATPAVPGRERALTYYTEERYWTDYAKLAVPVIIVIALLGGIWVIGSRRIQGDSPATATPGNVAAAATGGATPRPAGSAAMPTGSSVARSSLPPIITPGAGTPNPGGMGTAPAAGAGTRPPTLGTAVAAMRYKVNSQGGANMRAEPRTGGAIVTLVPDGTEVEGTGDAPQTDAMGAIWYKVKYGDKTGWIRSDLFAM